MNTNRIEQLLNGMTAYSNTYYPKQEILPELMALQREVVTLTFGKSSQNEKLMLKDVMTQMYRTNAELGHVADEEFTTFKKSCWTIINSIQAEISGAWGESRTMEKIERINTPFRVLRNVELHQGQKMTELDFVVITGKVIYIVEVKNTKKNIFIDEDGGYATRGRYSRMDCYIKYKMQTRERMLRSVLENAGIENPAIGSIVVFTNSRIEVENKCSDLKTCFLSQLHHVIEGYQGDIRYGEDDMERIMNVVESARSKISYCTEVDASQFKHDFAALLSKLEEARNAGEVKMDDTMAEPAEKAKETVIAINSNKTTEQRVVNRRVKTANTERRSVKKKHALIKRFLNSTAPQAAAFMILCGIASLVSE